MISPVTIFGYTPNFHVYSKNVDKAKAQLDNAIEEKKKKHPDAISQINELEKEFRRSLSIIVEIGYDPGLWLSLIHI